MIQAPHTVRRLTAGRDLPRLAREALLWFGAVAGVLCLVLAGLAVVFHITPVVFRSGSMAPTIDTGALALTRTVDAADLHVGDIVTVRTSKGARVTHRIRTITPNGDQVTLVLKGDANEVVDTEAYPVSSADRVIFSVPKLGYLVSGLSGRAGAFGGGLLIGLVLITAFSRKPRQSLSGLIPVRGFLQPPIMEDPVLTQKAGWRVRPKEKRRSYVIAASLGVLALALIAGIRGTNAYFLDSATADSGIFAMKVVVAPSLITACSRNVSTGDITVTWSVYPTATSYNLVTTSGTNQTQTNVTSPRAATVGKNNDGTVVVQAVTPTGTVTSVAWTYDLSGNNQRCHA